MSSTKRNEASSSSSKTPKESVVADCGKRRSSCGYCRSPRHNSISHGMVAYSLTVYDYQALLDRGWRRSGSFLYKPEMEKTCCPSYTIRLKASDFVPSKEQLRVSRRMQRFLDGTLDVKRVDAMEEPNTSNNSESLVHNNPSCSMSEESPSVSNKEVDEVEKSLHYLSDQIDNAVHMFTENGEFPSGIQLPKASVRMVSQGKKKVLANGSEDLLYSSNIAFQVAASINRAKSRDKDGNDSKPSRDSDKENGFSPKIIAEKLVASLDSTVNISGLSIRACNGHVNFYTSSKQVSQNGTVQKAAIPKKSATNRNIGGNRKLEIRLNRSSFDPEEYALYRKYQRKVHNDKPENYTESSYRRFLVDTPLIYVSHTGDNTVPPCGFGSFHQQYLVDGKLVAVGVIDILPNCLSSKYLFWDPDFAFLSLGKYSALQEIGWVKDNQAYCPSLQHYYLGYYIHSCNKMRYKAAYRPSELLCPLRYQWVSFDIARPLLDRKRYVVLSDASILQNGESSPFQVAEDQDTMLSQVDESGQEDANDVPMHGDEDEDEEMVESELESSDDEPDIETTSNGEPENGDFSKVLLGIKGSRVRYKDLQSVFGREQQRYLESQLQKYRRVVGPVLSERMVYSLG
ncbi:putative arginyltransferase [Medicago truncatula]|uniref:Arginyl-tRNA--protein transferase n=1 Tax=Medicago truncatula TaxID=3880 RepID=G7JB71_MEDTR|nr:arginyl-tRNA--protein transferase 2 [Medicago truncatula]AES71123.1 arginyl-tRNA-protein transferase [Medicago truncatula]RHN68382.1 putative arginyltransferase [Medicago truncatula]